MIQSPQQPSTPRQSGQFNFSCSSSMRRSTSSRLSGAELIRELSLQKLNRSDDSLYSVAGAGRHGRPAPIVKRFSDNYAERAQATRAAQRQMRAKLIRQSTTAAADAAVAATAGSRRRQMAASRDQRSWRSCDVDQSAVTGAMPRRSGRDLSPAPAARSMSGSIGRCDAINRQASCSSPREQPASFVDLTLSSGSLQRRPSAETTPNTTCDARPDDGRPPGPVRYAKAKSPGEDDRIVLPPLAGADAAPAASRPLRAQVARAAGNTTKKVLRGGRPVPRRQSTRRIVDRSSSVRRPADAERGLKQSEAEEALRVQRRRARGIVILTSVVLLFICLFMVGFTLHLAPLIDNLGKAPRRVASRVARGPPRCAIDHAPAELGDNLNALRPSRSSRQRDDSLPGATLEKN